MKVFSWKNIAAFVTWALIPVCLQIVLCFQYFILKSDNVTVNDIIRYLSIVNNIAIPLVLPVLMANLVSKSGPSPDKCDYYGKASWLGLYVVIHLVIIGLNIFTISKSPSIHGVIGIIVFTSLTVSCLMTMVIVNVVCTTFIENVITSSKTYGVDNLVEKYTHLVEKYEKIKVGFSPYLLIHLPVLTMFFLLYAYYIFSSISGGFFTNVGSVGLSLLGFTVHIFYIIILCDETYKTIRDGSNFLRYMSKILNLNNLTLDRF